MPGKYIFYDLETSGKGKKATPTSWSSPKWEQILQVGSIITDEKFVQTNRTLNKFCRPRISIISQPGALLTTRKGMKEILAEEYSSYELMSLINTTFTDWKQAFPGAIFIGHNSVEFDETVLEYNLFSNLFYPYVTRPNRGDTMNLSRGMYAINPNSLKIGINEKGSQIFKLEILAERNNLPIDSAHDALSDVRTTISLAKFLHENDLETWKKVELTMNAKNASDYINSNKEFCHLNYWFGKIHIQALSMVCESRYKGWYHTIDLKHDPIPLLEANLEEFKKLIKKKNRYIICNKNPILFSGKLATNYPPYDKDGSKKLNERAEVIFKNKLLADKFKHMEIDRQIEKEETSSQDNIFPEDKASSFLNFGQSEVIKQFHLLKKWEDKYKVALTLRDPNASFIAKRLIFDESPETLSENDFRLMHKELHERLLLNQERPFTTIPEAMSYVDTELSRIEDSNEDNKEESIKIINEYNQYLIFLDNYFSNKSAQPLKSGKELIKQIYND